MVGGAANQATTIIVSTIANPKPIAAIFFIVSLVSLLAALAAMPRAWNNLYQVSHEITLYVYKDFMGRSAERPPPQSWWIPTARYENSQPWVFS